MAPKIPVGSWLRLSKVIAASLINLASSEEESILTGASVVDHGEFAYPNFSEVIGEGFKSIVTTSNCCPMRELTVDFGKSMPVQSVFIYNRANNPFAQQRIGVSHIRIGDDSIVYSTKNTKIVDNITDGGFFEASQLLSGRYLTLRRDLSSPVNNNMEFRNLKVYQTPNLVKLYASKISITPDTSSSVIGSEATNLITNLEHRSSHKLYEAITVSVPETRLGSQTCFEVEYTSIKSQGNKMIIGFDFTESVFIHAVLHAQNEGTGNWAHKYSGPDYLKTYY